MLLQLIRDYPDLILYLIHLRHKVLLLEVFQVFYQFLYMFGDLVLQRAALEIVKTEVITGLDILLNVPILITKAEKLIHKNVSVDF